MLCCVVPVTRDASMLSERKLPSRIRSLCEQADEPYVSAYECSRLISRAMTRCMVSASLPTTVCVGAALRIWHTCWILYRSNVWIPTRWLQLERMLNCTARGEMGPDVETHHYRICEAMLDSTSTSLDAVSELHV
jgi:hypothetical protein